MRVEDLIVSAECVETGERLIGYVCGCKTCRTPIGIHDYDKSRPIGVLTHPDELYGGIKVYTDTLERYVNDWVKLNEQIPPINEEVEVKFYVDGEERIHTNKLISMLNGNYIWAYCDYDDCIVTSWRTLK